MLILTRRQGEAIKIGDDITVTVLNINNGQVRLGIRAPKQIEVHREEIYDKIRERQGKSPRVDYMKRKLKIGEWL